MLMAGAASSSTSGVIREAPHSAKTGETLLGPLKEFLAGKRKSDDAELDELFNGKKQKSASDHALAAEVLSRHIAPTPELIDEVVRRRCRGAAKALLSLPELQESAAVRLLVAWPEHLALVVSWGCASHQLEEALRDHVPASTLEQMLEVLLSWLQAYRDLPEAVVKEAAPGIPTLSAIVEFLACVGVGCMSTVARQDKNLLERVVEALEHVRIDQKNGERLFASARALYKIDKPLTAASESVLSDVVRLPL